MQGADEISDEYVPLTEACQIKHPNATGPWKQQSLRVMTKSSSAPSMFPKDHSVQKPAAAASSLWGLQLDMPPYRAPRLTHPSPCALHKKSSRFQLAVCILYQSEHSHPVPAFLSMCLSFLSSVSPGFHDSTLA